MDVDVRVHDTGDGFEAIITPPPPRRRFALWSSAAARVALGYWRSPEAPDAGPVYRMALPPLCDAEAAVVSWADEAHMAVRIHWPRLARAASRVAGAPARPPAGWVDLAVAAGVRTPEPVHQGERSSASTSSPSRKPTSPQAAATV